jgi:hypothetical protein
VTELTLTFDHRVCDGGTAGGFLRYIAHGHVADSLGLVAGVPGGRAVHRLASGRMAGPGPGSAAGMGWTCGFPADRVTGWP